MLSEFYKFFLGAGEGMGIGAEQSPTPLTVNLI